MSVRAKIAATIVFTGLFTALCVLLAVAFSFKRFEHESAYYRGDAFLKRVVSRHNDLLDMQQRFPEEFTGFLRNLVLYEPDTQLYVLDAQGAVITSTLENALPAGLTVRLAPVREAAGSEPMPYVMGDDPENMGARAIVAAKALNRSVIRPGQAASGYLYLVSRPPSLGESRMAALRGTLSQPAFQLLLCLVAVATLLAAWVTAQVTRPLARLTTAVSEVTKGGLDGLASGAVPASGAMPVPGTPWPHVDSRDEFGQLARGMGAMMQTLQTQWATLRRLDHFRREGVSNLSHDLRSPLTATAACLETLDNRWAAHVDAAQDRQLIAVALRNTRNAARLVQSLGDLAQLDEPEFRIRADVIDVAELLDDVAMRFAERARSQGIALLAQGGTGAPVLARLDVALFERALANLVDNALKFSPAGARITLAATHEAQWVAVRVHDTGPGIAAADLPHLFDRFYQSRQSAEPASSESGKGLGLAIVKRIAELHGGRVEVTSTPGTGTTAALLVPPA